MHMSCFSNKTLHRVRRRRLELSDTGVRTEKHTLACSMPCVAHDELAEDTHGGCIWQWGSQDAREKQASPSQTVPRTEVL